MTKKSIGCTIFCQKITKQIFFFAALYKRTQKMVYYKRILYFRVNDMLEYDEIRLELNGMKPQLDDLAEALGLEKNRAEIAKLE